MCLYTKTKNIISFIINLFITANMIITIATFFITGGDGNMMVKGWLAFRFYTIDSNVLCALACLAVLAYNTKALKSGELILPDRIFLLKYAGVVAVSMTFLIVILFLGPTQGYSILFDKTIILMHSINPVLAFVGFLMEKSDAEFTRKKTFWGCISFLIYGTVYAIMVVAVKTWPDFYGFTQAAEWWICFPVMMIFGYLVSLGVRAIHQKAKI